ncbi:MAG: hypothetical protein HC836_10520 [Richelia sp. RM2_1_2]|nr:hypothetical protein [Richelia sp. RM2_1_2]
MIDPKTVIAAFDAFISQRRGLIDFFEATYNGNATATITVLKQDISTAEFIEDAFLNDGDVLSMTARILQMNTEAREKLFEKLKEHGFREVIETTGLVKFL